MSKAFQQALHQAQALSPQEQLALVAALSQWLAQQEWPTLPYEGMLPEEDENEVLNRVKAFENGEGKTISGTTFRKELRKKYGS